MFGPTPADEVIRLTEDAHATMTSPQERGGACDTSPGVLACRGEFGRARELHLEGVNISREGGMLRTAAASSMGTANIETRAGDLDAAEAALRSGIEELDALGDRGFYTTVVCLLAEVLVNRGREEEAAAWCARARETASPSDLATVAQVEALESLLPARRGDHAQGERLARSAVAMLAGSDFSNLTAGARMLLARTLVECGKQSEAREAAADALALYEAKGDEPAAGWARELLASLA